MTDEQINAAIAEACGWENLHRHPLNPNAWVGENVGMLEEVLDYCNCLNAMHEAEKMLGNKLNQYGEWLCEMTHVNEHNYPDCYIWHKTARQRAEAFLRTLGKWEEVQS